MSEMVDNAVALSVFNDSIRIFRTERLTTGGCGNKQFKLTKNLNVLKQRGCTSVLSFGGLWSNHLHAFSLACEKVGLQAVAVVRGEVTPGTVLLDDAIKHGLKVLYVSRGDYLNRYNESYVAQLVSQLDCDTWLPEGGSNHLAVEGCKEIVEWIKEYMECTPTHIALAVGTGATISGVINAVESHQQVIGVPVVQDDRLPDQICSWLGPESEVSWQLLNTAKPPRYGSVNSRLLEFILSTYDRTGIILDPVYNAKALRSVMESGIADDSGSDVVFVHTGGIGGCLGFSDKFLEIDTLTAERMLIEVRRMLGIDV